MVLGRPTISGFEQVTQVGLERTRPAGGLAPGRHPVLPGQEGGLRVQGGGGVGLGWRGRRGLSQDNKPRSPSSALLPFLGAGFRLLT